jgi:hypothetical protein
MRKKNYTILILIVSLIIVSLLILTSNPIEKFQASTPTSQVYDIIIVAGQSNAVGYGKRNSCDSRNSLAGCTTRTDRITHNNNSTRFGAITDISNNYESTNPKIKQFSSENAAVVANRNKIIDMSEPLQHFNNTSNRYVSFAFHFAKEYLARTSMGSREVLIVGCAWPGASMIPSAIADSAGEPRKFYRKPIAGDNLTVSLYNRTVQRLRNVKTQLAPSNNSKVVAFLWHQGETDMSITVCPSCTNADKINYKSALKESLTGMRTEIMGIFNNNNSGYTYPILLGGFPLDKDINRITGAVNPLGTSRAMSSVVSQVSNRMDPYFIQKSAFVPTVSLPTEGRPTYNFSKHLEGNSTLNIRDGTLVGTTDDNTHFSATANREFGKRYFHYYNGIR